MATEYGLLLPHFGEQASMSKVVDGSKKAEALGFDSVFVRDHLIFHPHGMEGTDNTFYDPFMCLAAIGAVTSKIKLGFGSLIPHRHPLLLALMLNSLAEIAGDDRLVLSFGLGNFQVEFDALGIGEWKRDELVPEQVEILRKAWTQEHFDHEGKYYQFHHVGFKPRPAESLPIWYAGGTPAAVRRAIEYCEGWLPGRITLATYKKRVEKLREGGAEKGKRILEGCIPITSIDHDRETALRKVSVSGLLDNANKQKFWVKPESGKFEKAEDLEGSFIYGSPDDVVKEVEKYLEVGIDHLVFDFRFRYDEWDESIELLGKEVLPRLRKLQS